MTLYRQNYVGYADTWKWNNQPKHDMYCILQTTRRSYWHEYYRHAENRPYWQSRALTGLTLFWVCKNFLTTIFKLTKNVCPFEIPAEVSQLPVKRLKQHVQPLNLIIHTETTNITPLPRTGLDMKIVVLNRLQGHPKYCPYCGLRSWRPGSSDGIVLAYDLQTVFGEIDRVLPWSKRLRLPYVF